MADKEYRFSWTVLIGDALLLLCALPGLAGSFLSLYGNPDALPDEAAARSLSDRTPEKVAALVGNIVEERMNLEQFSDCDITMRELTVVTRTVTNQLAGVYHSRVKYPKLVLSRK